MALSQARVISRIGQLVATVEPIKRAYAASESGDDRMPESALEFPCAFVWPEATEEFIPTTGRHTYLVTVQVITNSGMFWGQALAVLTPIVDSLIALFVVNQGLGGAANSCTFAGGGGLRKIILADIEYPGFDISLRVSEQSYTQPAIGLSGAEEEAQEDQELAALQEIADSAAAIAALVGG